ncbi:uncharacterized protein E0L32_009809 [Thyridium curvatum]|uniref:tRNA (adenine(58)-N(1))-methyltransferase catalytic subunit TRM61 n=1 Tax=Thyridium curvatum TaxID=1093900 RepID=A0A507AN78_9PEZI|nr:uncharacterized protein E0L32_009809 [Thyridium curvatum]TPX08747.1 hypothetical protein E0L32_009809 [Thyridium curvatum]
MHATLEHDTVFLEAPYKGGEYRLHRAGPLKADEPVQLKDARRTTLDAAHIIGKSSRDVIKTRKGLGSDPPLDESGKTNTQDHSKIYPADANFIVSLLDINLPVPGEDPDADAQPPFEIFEAGTGMGSLTLHLARAIHGANPPVSPSLRQSLVDAPYQRSNHNIFTSPADPEPSSDPSSTSEPTTTTTTDPSSATLSHHTLDFPTEAQSQAWEAHLSSRRAVIHTLDNRPAHSRSAHKNVRRFRRALYLPDIDFHIGSVQSYLSARLAAAAAAATSAQTSPLSWLEEEEDHPFLAHAILDLPDAWDTAGELAIRCLKPDGLLVVFAAQLTQVVRFAAEAARSGAPVRQERVVELATSTVAGGSGGGEGTLSSNLAGTGGREWDVRLVRGIRKTEAAEEAGGEVVDLQQTPEERLVTVCRPKVGAYTAGGGFVAVFRKLETRSRSWVSGQGRVDAEGVAAVEQKEMEVRRRETE